MFLSIKINLKIVYSYIIVLKNYKIIKREKGLLYKQGVKIFKD